MTNMNQQSFAFVKNVFLNDRKLIENPKKLLIDGKYRSGK